MSSTKLAILASSSPPLAARALLLLSLSFSLTPASFAKPGHHWSANDARLERRGAEPGPDLIAGTLRLLSDKPSENNLASFAKGAPPCRRLTARFELELSPGADGFCLAWLNTETWPADKDPLCPSWEEPNLPGALAIAFDIYEPPGRNPFDAVGNIYNRPQREVSIHWNGVERFNALSPIEYRSRELGERHTIELSFEFVTGGLEFTLRVDDTLAFAALFIPDVQSFPARPLIAARSGGVTAQLKLHKLEIEASEPIANLTAPEIVSVLHGGHFSGNQHRIDAPVELPELDSDIGRYILRIRLRKPEGGWDEWDRCANVAIVSSESCIEVARLITPYAREWTWYADISDFRPLLRGKVVFRAFLETWAAPEKGFLLDLQLAIYRGPTKTRVTSLIPLWQGSPLYGHPEHPISDFFKSRELALPPRLAGLRARMTVTGHGQAPNTGNAAEFLPRQRWLLANGRRFENRLWRQDCYLNPCRPQGGTWKFDRAGWAPGDLVAPWIVDLKDLIGQEKLTLAYDTEDYKNERPGGGDARYWVESVLLIEELIATPDPEPDPKPGPRPEELKKREF